jgi:hypothetical protein
MAFFDAKSSQLVLGPGDTSPRVQESPLHTLEARCRSGHYLAAVVPITDEGNRTGYQVLVFRQGNEVYEETEQSLEQAIQTAKAYLDWRVQQDLDS